MKKILVFLSLAVSFAGLISFAAENGIQGIVSADKVLMRLGPGVKYPRGGVLTNGQQVRILARKGSWLVIAAPENLPVYLDESRIDERGVLYSELNMRTRKDINSPSYGVLPKGALVKKLNERAYGWVRIAPPEGLKVYVHQLYIKFDSAALDQLADTAAIPAGPAMPAESTAKPAETEKPAETVKPAETEKPAEAVKPAETEKPAEAVKPAETEKPAEAVKPAETEKPAEAVKPAETVAAPAVKPAANQEGILTLEGYIASWKYGRNRRTSFVLLDAPRGSNRGFLEFSKEVDPADLVGRKVRLTAVKSGENEFRTPVYTVSAAVVIEEEK